MGIQKRQVARNRLRVLRAEQRMTQLTLALKARINPATVSLIENCHVEPTPDQRGRLARALKTAVVDAFPESEAIAS